MSVNLDWKRRIDESADLPRVRGTSISVQTVLDAIAEGWSVERLLARLPELTEEDVRSCIAFAADAVRREAFARLVRVGLAEANAGLLVPDEELDEFFGPDSPDDELP